MTVIPKIGTRVMNWATRNVRRTTRFMARQIDPNGTGLPRFQPALAGPAINGASIPTVRVPDRTVPDVRVIQNANNGSNSVAGGSRSQQVSQPAKKEVDADLITYARKYRIGKIKSGIGYAFSIVGGLTQGVAFFALINFGMGLDAFLITCGIGAPFIFAGINIGNKGSKQMLPSKKLVEKYRERNLPDILRTLQPGAARALERRI